MKKNKSLITSIILVAILVITGIYFFRMHQEQVRINNYKALFVKHLKHLGVPVHAVIKHPEQKDTHIVRFGSNILNRLTPRLLLKNPEANLRLELDRWVYLLKHQSSIPVRQSDAMEISVMRADTQMIRQVVSEKSRKDGDLAIPSNLQKPERLRLVYLLRHAEDHAQSNGQLKNSLTTEESAFCEMIDHPKLSFHLNDEKPIDFLKKIAPDAPQVAKQLNCMLRGKVVINTYEQLPGKQHFSFHLTSTHRGTLYAKKPIEMDLQAHISGSIDAIKSNYGLKAFEALIIGDIAASEIIKQVEQDQYGLTKNEKKIFLRNVNAFAEILRITILEKISE